LSRSEGWILKGEGESAAYLEKSFTGGRKIDRSELIGQGELPGAKVGMIGH